MRKFPICWWCIVLAMLTATACNHAFAQTTYYWANSSHPSLTGATPELACRAFANQSAIFNYAYTFRINDTTRGCAGTYKSGSPAGNYTMSEIIRIGSACPAGQTYSGQTGLCSGPVAPTCTAGEFTRTEFKTGTGAIGAPYATSPILDGLPKSNGTCDVAYDTIEKCEGVVNTATNQQDFYCTFTGKKTGTATPAGSNPPQPSTIPAGSNPKPAETTPFNPQTGQGCPAGTTAIGVDSSGTSICAGSGTSPSTPTQTEVREPTVNVTNPDGSTSSTDVIRRTNADGSVTTTTINVNISPTGVKTTTTSTVTGNAPGGGAGKNDKANDDPKGNSPVATGELYAKKDKTFQTVFGAWKTSLETAPVVAAGKAFFTVNVSGGGCPSWSADVPYLNTTISMGDIFCGSTANSIYAVIKIGLLIGAAYMAFRMAFL